MKASNVLAQIFDWLGDALERFNPSAFRFLAAVLPYLTPIPVAWLTAHSASDFLHFTPNVSFIFVFALEGIGLWFTTLLVDAVVDFVRSRNPKTFLIVIMFVLVVGAYVLILVNLNVTLETANNANTNPALSQVITLLCFLPLITGVGNGYYKLKLDYRTETEQAQRRTDELNERIRQENRHDRMERYRIKNERKAQDSERTTIERRTTNRTQNVRRTNGQNNEQRTKIEQYVRSVQNTEQRTPGPTEISQNVGVAKSYAYTTLQAILREQNGE